MYVANVTIGVTTFWGLDPIAIAIGPSPTASPSKAQEETLQYIL